MGDGGMRAELATGEGTKKPPNLENGGAAHRGPRPNVIHCIAYLAIPSFCSIASTRSSRRTKSIALNVLCFTSAIWPLSVAARLWVGQPRSLPPAPAGLRRGGCTRWCPTPADGTAGGVLRCTRPSCCWRCWPPGQSATTDTPCTIPSWMSPSLPPPCARWASPRRRCRPRLDHRRTRTHLARFFVTSVRRRPPCGP
jgi:hypothetical protein